MMAYKAYRTINVLVIVMGALVALSGCFDLPSESKIETFRILGIQAEPPEIAPGEGTNLAVLWVDPSEKEREVTLAWIICGGYVHSSEGLSTCEMLAPPVVATAEEGGDRLEIPETPKNILDDYDIFDVGRVQATVVVLMCADGKLPKPEAFESKKDVVNINTLCKGGEGISAYKTVTISKSDNPQRNPTIDRLEADDEVVQPAEDDEPFKVKCTKKEDCGAEVELKMYLTKQSKQSYEQNKGDETVTVKERMSVSWYVTGEGDVEAPTVGPADDNRLGPYETVWHPEEPGTFTIYAVARDVRGGTSWRQYTFEVQSK